MGTVTALGRNVAAASEPPSLDGLISQRRVWRGQATATAPALEQPTGWPFLDATLPARGWPAAALSELWLPADGIGELQLLWPTLARLSQPNDGVIALIAPPYHPYPPAWQAAGVRLGALQVIRTKTPRDALWAAEQCLRSGACDAVLCWPQQADDRALRRLQVAAETGQALGFAFRPMKAALNPSPAALRIALDSSPRQLRVLKCRGGIPSARAIPFPVQGHPEPFLRQPIQQRDAPAPIRAPAIHRQTPLPKALPSRHLRVTQLLPIDLAQNAPDRAGIGI